MVDPIATKIMLIPQSSANSWNTSNGQSKYAWSLYHEEFIAYLTATQTMFPPENQTKKQENASSFTQTKHQVAVTTTELK